MGNSIANSAYAADPENAGSAGAGPLAGAAALVRMSAGELVAGIARGDFSATEVLAAQVARIEEVEPRINALVVRRFERARGEAAEVDAARRRGETLGPLAGLPLSIKECLDLDGTASTLGLRTRAAHRAASDGPLVARLRAAGAIVVGKTNVPQLAMYLETDGPLFGRTNNPWNLERSPGGSSGGEAALIAAGGSPLGLATDAGGSIRQPAHACGICGLKPTSGRLTQGDLPVTTTRSGDLFLPTNLAGLHSILQPGPMARSVDDLDLALSVLAAPGLETIDPTVAPAPWPDSRRVPVDRLRIGYFADDGSIAPAPAVRRAVDQAVAALAATGAELIPFAPPEVDWATAIFRGLIFPDGGQAFARMLGDEVLDPRLKQIMQGARLPNVLRRPVSWMLEASGQPRLARSVRDLRKLSADGFRIKLAERAHYTARFLAAMDAAGIDAVVCPPSPVPAPTHGSGSSLGLMASYTSLFNLLGFPAGVLPVTRVQAGEETDRQASRDTIERAAAAIERGSAGLPIGVQVAARPWREDVVLAVMREIERRVGWERLADRPHAGGQVS